MTARERSLLDEVDAVLEDAEGASLSSFAASSSVGVFKTIESIRSLGDTMTFECEPPSIFLWPSLLSTNGHDDAPMLDAHEVLTVKREYAHYLAASPTSEHGTMPLDEFQARRRSLQASASPATPAARTPSVAATVKTPASMCRAHETALRVVDQFTTTTQHWDAERAVRY